ncbi:tetraphosphate phosphorylase [Diaporthe amygdali]|uniref:tetraphosphate phosphorylase n=1 Tax=Phomopsis amygdali TaxID=1214568 RepID=UPI0022FF06FB|nr:tetraphosphate phosphorylase [Diaporthe amygdali]KAJ0122506.1 tetraphosphate phosphorylase [Diaporthe amygdali]
MSPIKLPDDLELQALTRFDTLVSQGNLFYEETQGEIAEDKGFKFEFRISQALSKKPILTHDAPERRGVGGPFLHPDPAFVVSHVGHRHILELNMHCIHRPMYILHTREFVSQDDDLDLDDLSAVHAVMANLGRKVPQMAIYNCGAEAGASQGHKHLQIFASPSPFPLFPEQVQSTQGHISCSDFPSVAKRVTSSNAMLSCCL